ncbi:MFS transporter [Nocardioides panacihumi]|uniref:MFS transporter n=1 Tax=Nocardioides panacihumi TaxID=400774 RepID=A0ABN2R569_9ACTN
MSSTAQADPPVVSPSGHRHLGWALVLICIAQLMVVLDATIANIALPFIQKDLDFTPANLTWVVTGYSLTFGGLLLLGGRLGDLYGRRRVFMTGLLLFAAASLVGGLAGNEAMLLVSRAFQGTGAALAAPSALALITTTFPAGPGRNRAFAVYAAMSGVGAAVGLILGGWLTGLDGAFGISVEGWRLTFLINVPIGVLAALAAPMLLEESERHTGELDVPGAITGTAGLLSVVYGLTRASSHGWTDGLTLTFLIGGVALLGLFALIETRVEHPLLPFRIFASRTRASSFVAMMLLPAAMFAMFFYLSQYIQLVKGYTPLHTGVAFLPFCVGMVLAATIASNLVNRIDPRYLAGVGTLLAAIALFGFSRIPSDTTLPIHAAEAGYWGHVFPWVTLMAIGMGLTFVPVTLTAVHHLRTEDAGIGSGVLNTMQQVGGALGLAILSTVATHVMTSDGEKLQQAAAAAGGGKPPADVLTMIQHQVFAHGSTTAFLVGSAMALVGSAIIWIFLDVKHEELATDLPEGVHVG